MANPGGIQNNLKRFLKENRTLAFSLPVLVILIVALVIIYSGVGGGKPADAVPAMAENSAGGVQENQVEILPQTERTADATGAENTAAVDGGTVKDPFSGPVTLAGVVIREDGDNVAILEGGGKSFVVKTDDVLENNMIVGSISSDRVLLNDNGREIELKLQHLTSSQPAAE